MAWCPNCGDGYREDVTHCGWCGAALIPGEMPQEAARTPTAQLEGWKQLCRVGNPTHVSLILGVLQGADIPVLAWDEGLGQYLRIVLGSNALGQDILVPEDRWPEARDLLSAYYQARPSAMIFEDDDEAAAQAEASDRAQSSDGSWRTFPGLMLALYWVIVLLALTSGSLSLGVQIALLVLGGGLSVLLAKSRE